MNTTEQTAEDKRITVQQAAERLNVTVHAIYKALKENRLECDEVFDRKVFTPEQIAAYIPAGHGGKRERRSKEQNQSAPMPT